jgi:hypothetical protein
MAQIDRVLLLTMDCLYSAIYVKGLMQVLGERSLHVVLSNPMRRSQGGHASIAWRSLKRSGLAYTQYLGRAFGPVSPELEGYLRRRNVRVTRTDDVNGAHCFDAIRSSQPDLILCCGFDQLVKRRVFEVPAVGAINIHPSLLPRNRGPDPVFWALSRGDEVGLSAHYMNERFDEGDIVLSKTCETTRESVLDTMVDLMREVPSLLKELLEGLENEHLVARAQGPGGYDSFPSAADVRNAARRGVRLTRRREARAHLAGVKRELRSDP